MVAIRAKYKLATLAAWVKVIGDITRGVNDNVGYVVRKSARGERIFAIKQGFAGEQNSMDVTEFPDYDYYSDNRFAVSLDGAYRIREASIEEWNAAQKPVHSYHFINKFLNTQHTNEGVQYKGCIANLVRRGAMMSHWFRRVGLGSPFSATRAAISLIGVSPDFLREATNREDAKGSSTFTMSHPGRR